MSYLSHVMTLANGVIGVSVLAMPFCFEQCGIILATVVLLLSSALSRLACHLLIKSAVMSRRRNFEFLAFHAFGRTGKIIVELFIVGFLIGTCVAFFVVVGDLGPQIIGKIIDRQPEDIRTSFLIITGVFIVLPLGLLRNVDSLSSICTASIGFYLCLVLKIVAESTRHIFAGDWYDRVYYWRPAGILRCLPIFSMALFCQTQLFEIYETVPNASLEKMNEIVRGALNICNGVYICVGFFGYIAFCNRAFSGNILTSFEPGTASEVIKLGFVFSVVFSFPLVIFPCRASMNSLLFRKVHGHDSSSNYIPETKFRCLTIVIVVASLIVGVLIPNIEFVLGLVGSTIGVTICLIFPAAFFISISSKHTNERLMAQIILFIGVWIMILGTYTNLYATEESSNAKLIITTNKSPSRLNNVPLGLIDKEVPLIPAIVNLEEPDLLKNTVAAKDGRREPPIPVERVAVTEKPALGTEKSVIADITVGSSPEPKVVADAAAVVAAKISEKIELPSEKLKKNSPKEDMVILKAEEKIKVIEAKEQAIAYVKGENLIHSDAIQKEESELAADGELNKIEVEERHEELRKTLEKHKIEQLEMIQEQKELLKDLKEQKQEFEKEKKERLAKDAVQGKREVVKVVKPNPENVVEKAKVPLLVPNVEKDKLETTSDVIFKNNSPPMESENIKVTPRMDDRPKNMRKSEKEERESFLKVNINNNEIAKGENDKTDNNSDTKLIPVAGGNVSVMKAQGPILDALSRKNTIPEAKQFAAAAEENNKDRIIVRNKEHFKLGEERDVAIGDAKEEKQKDRVEGAEDPKRTKYSVPIALMMQNQTKRNDSAVNDKNKNLVGRDILENHEREKRESMRADSDVNVEKREEKCLPTGRNDLSFVGAKQFLPDVEINSGLPRVLVPFYDKSGGLPKRSDD